MPQDQKSLSYGVCIYSKSSSTEVGVEFIYEFEYARVLAKYISFGVLVVWRSVGNESLRVPYRQLVARELMNSEDVVRVNC